MYVQKLKKKIQTRDTHDFINIIYYVINIDEKKKQIIENNKLAQIKKSLSMNNC